MYSKLGRYVVHTYTCVLLALPSSQSLLTINLSRPDRITQRETCVGVGMRSCQNVHDDACVPVPADLADKITEIAPKFAAKLIHQSLHHPQAHSARQRDPRRNLQSKVLDHLRGRTTSTSCRM